MGVEEKSNAKNDVKGTATVARDSRMTLRKNNEEVLRKALQTEARKKCLEESKAFGDCAKASGVWVVLSCRKENLVSVSFVVCVGSGQ